MERAASFEQFKQQLEHRASSFSKRGDEKGELLRLLGSQGQRRRGLASAFAQTCAAKFAAGAGSVTCDELVRLHIGNPRFVIPAKVSNLMTRCARLIKDEHNYCVTAVNAQYFAQPVEVVNEEQASRYLSGYGQATAGLVVQKPASHNWLLLAELRRHGEMACGAALGVLSYGKNPEISESLARCEEHLAMLDRVAREWQTEAV